MDWTEIRANWTELTGAILTRWPEADEDDVLALDGDRDAFVAYIAGLERLPVEEAEDRVQDWASTAMPADVRMDPAQASARISDSRAYVAPGEDPSDADEAFGDETMGERNEPDPPVGRTGG